MTDECHQSVEVCTILVNFYVGDGFEKAAFFISSFFKAFVAFLININSSEIRIFNDVVKYSSSWSTRKCNIIFIARKNRRQHTAFRNFK